MSGPLQPTNEQTAVNPVNIPERHKPSTAWGLYGTARHGWEQRGRLFRLLRVSKKLVWGAGTHVLLRNFTLIFLVCLKPEMVHSWFYSGVFHRFDSMFCFVWSLLFKKKKKKKMVCSVTLLVLYSVLGFVAHWWCERHVMIKHTVVFGVVSCRAQTWSIWSCWPRYTVSGSDGGRNRNSESQKFPSPSTLCRLSQTTFSSVRKPWSVTRRYSWP